MYQQKFSFLTILTIFFLALASCTLVKPTPDLTGLDQPILIDSYQVRIAEAAISTSYATHYIMHYAPASYVFYTITAEFQGFETPQSALDWGRQNFQLTADRGSAQLAHATWTLVGDHIQYQSGQDFHYRYLYYYLVSTNDDYAQYHLELTGGPSIQINTILQLLGNTGTEQSAAATPQDGTPAPADLLHSGGQFAALGGGSQNTASAYHTTVSGGLLNTASSAYAFVGGGRENVAANLYTTIAGGYANQADGRDSVVSGGSRNTAEGYHTVISGGIRNQATASDTTISGGSYNQASDLYATVAGGTRNLAGGSASVVGGGAGNTASAEQATVSGGLANQASANYATVSGGQENTAAGFTSTVPGGASNQAGSDYSLAAGRRAIISSDHPGAFLFADSQDADFLSTAPDEFAVRATGGVRLVTATDAHGSPLSGLSLAPGSGAWATLSDRALKENFHPIDPQQILEGVANMPISTWNYTTQDSTIRHIGPVAQDFYAAFGTGESERTITTIDADGVALAAIQALNQSLQEKETHLQILETRLAALEAQTRLTHVLIVALLVTLLILLLRKPATPSNHHSHLTNPTTYDL